MADVPITIDVKSCEDCPHFKATKADHWMAPANNNLYSYRCKKAGRDIYPSDGIKPPPSWCPLRKEKT